MGFFDFLKRRSAQKPLQGDDIQSLVERLQAGAFKEDHLYDAAAAGAKAKEAAAAGKFDEAWGLYQDQKQHYLKHAARSGFTKAQVLALDASVSESLANILRLEGKHHDALVHIVYWVAASSRVTKSQQQKIPAYFNRCKFKNITLSEFTTLIETSRPNPDFKKFRDIIYGWRQSG